MPYNKEEGRGTQMKRRPMRRRKKKYFVSTLYRNDSDFL